MDRYGNHLGGGGGHGQHNQHPGQHPGHHGGNQQHGHHSMNGSNGGLNMNGLPQLNMGGMPPMSNGYDLGGYDQGNSYMNQTSYLNVPPPAMHSQSGGSGMQSLSSSAAHSPMPAATNNAPKAAKAKPAVAASRKRKAPSETQSIPDAPDSPTSSKGGDENSSDPKARRRAQIAKAARKHRQRQKDELVALRDKVKDLKEQIEVLQSSEPSEHDTEIGWKQEAEQHAEIRARVDQENEFLRKTLMEQMKFIQRLQDYFTKQPLLNAPSLNKMLTSSPSMGMSAPPAPALMPPPTMPSSFFQLPTVSFRETLQKLADEGMQMCTDSIQYGEQLFRAPLVPNMTYLGMTVQYEVAKDAINVFSRLTIPHVNFVGAADKIWDLYSSRQFHLDFPLTESFEVLDAIDNDTKYTRSILNLTLPNPDKNGNSKVKSERLHIVKRRNVGNAVYIASRSVNDDPSWPPTPSYVRRNMNVGIMLRDTVDEGRPATECMWCIKVIMDQYTDTSVVANSQDTILRNLFEVTPAFFKAMVEKVQL
ncbi:hypothetical protein H257_05891 [Aphanomyces astaci]|uniref:BZIP domain-containing protein n=1 Tax=Aphanomyces astaci TaxID=112090 RepID=W4GNQ2_APHAT|nr:hypothetical protein H257_05891 [Aphanomyces astaci]ETV81345.1 hypothetical protein H257_05891 [Aphanomyces astaci]|eukprot:XP_009829203.1 hypothetical protein H257_05891 [Aphanomyces astaci]